MEILADRDVRLLTLSGPPGIGKTALTGLVGLHLTTMGTQSHHIDATLARSHVDVRRLLRRHDLDASPTARGPVVILDGCDRVADPDALQGLTDQMPHTRFLLTSSHPLGLTGERVYWVKPLPTSGPSGGAGPAGELLLRHAERRDPHFDPASVPPAQVQALSSLVEGYPLGLAILASRLSRHHPQVLSSRLGALAAGSSAPRWPAQLQALLSQVEQDIPPAAAVLLRRLAIWEGPVPLDLLLEADVGPRADGMETADLIEHLVNACCLEGASPTGVPAYQVPRAVRDHLLARLERLDEIEATERRRALAVASYVRARAEGLLAGESTAHAEVDLIGRDLTGVLDHLIDHGPVVTGLQLALDLAPMITRRGHVGLGRQLRTLLSHARHDAVPDDLLALGLALRAQTTLIHDPLARPRREARALEQSVDLARESGDPVTLLRCLLAVIQAAPITGDEESAIRAATEAVDLLPRLGSRWHGMALGWAGMVWRQAGRTELAEELYARVLEELNEYSDAELRFVCVLLWSVLPDVSLRESPLDLDQVVAEARERGDVFQESILLKASAGAALLAGDAALAAQRCLESLVLPRAEDFWRSELYAVTYLQQVALHRQDLQQAAVMHGIVQRHLDLTQLSLSSSLEEVYATRLSAIRGGLGETSFLEAADHGASLGTDGAVRMLIAYAREAAGREQGQPAPPVLDPGHVPLTPRERQVLEILATGATNKEIAETLGISAKTVMHNAAAIYQKLGVRGRAEAAAWAVRRQRG